MYTARLIAEPPKLVDDGVVCQSVGKTRKPTSDWWHYIASNTLINCSNSDFVTFNLLMITRLPRSLSPWRAVPLSVTKPSRRHQQEIHFHNTAVNAAEVKVRYHAVPKISHVPTDNPLLRARYRVSESNAVVLNVDEKFVRFSCLFLRDSCKSIKECFNSAYNRQRLSCVFQNLP